MVQVTFKVGKVKTKCDKVVVVVGPRITIPAGTEGTILYVDKERTAYVRLETSLLNCNSVIVLYKVDELEYLPLIKPDYMVVVK